MQKTILVVFGGVSNENEISVITGTMTTNVLIKGGYKVLPCYISQTGEIYCAEELADISNFKGEKYRLFPKAVIGNGGVFTLNKRNKIKKFTAVDACVNCAHGGACEGGAISGLCAIAGIPLASAKIFESSVFMDKYSTKLILSSLGVKTAEYVLIKSVEEIDSCRNMPEFPLIVKPVNLGSSIGVEKAETMEELKRAVECGLIYDNAVLVEKYLENRREINCAVYFADGKAVTSECEEAFTKGDILSYEDKYQGGGKSVLPADIPPNMSQLIKEITQKVYTALDMRGIVRFDFILCGEEIYLSEVNTVPGSLSYYLLSKGFKDFINVLNGVIEQAISDDNNLKSKKLLHTGILENISSNNIKLGGK